MEETPKPFNEFCSICHSRRHESRSGYLVCPNCDGKAIDYLKL